MGSHQVVFSPHANRDLEQIVRHIARDNPAAAERLGRRLIALTSILGKTGTATIGTKLQKRPNIRWLVEGNYLIFYRILPDQKKVRILRFWHSSRNPKSLRLGD